MFEEILMKSIMCFNTKAPALYSARAIYIKSLQIIKISRGRSSFFFGIHLESVIEHFA